MEVGPLRSAEELGDAFGPLAHAFSFVPEGEWLERDHRLHPWERMLVARDGEAIVGSAGAFPFEELTVPGGGTVRAAGVTWVAVLPTHRRRGVMRALVERQLADCRERGEPVAALWASEGSIYGRFGYGLASISCDIDFPRDRAAFALPAGPGGRVRLVGLEEAAAAFPPVYDRVRRETAGMLSRSETWWADKTLVNPDYFGQGSVPLRHAVLELDGAVEGYAMYRVHKGFGDGAFSMTLQVVEAIATSPRATQLLWEFLFGIDLVGRIHSRRLPPDHPLYLGVTEPARLMMRMGDGLWLRLVDLEAALAARTLRPAEPVVVEVADEHCPWNAGVWQLGPDGASRSSGAPEVRLGVAELGCAYLGCFTFAQLRWTGRLDELTPGAVERLDAMFRTDRFPWCPEVF